MLKNEGDTSVSKGLATPARPEERAEGRRHRLRCPDTLVGSVPQNKSGNVGSLYGLKKERPTTEVLKEKLTNEKMVLEDGVDEKPAF